MTAKSKIATEKHTEEIKDTAAPHMNKDGTASMNGTVTTQEPIKEKRKPGRPKKVKLTDVAPIVPEVPPHIRQIAFPPGPLTPLCKELQGLQRQRTVVLKSRNMQANRLQAIIAGTLGYSASMEEKDRRAKFTEASEVIDNVMEGKSNHPMEAVIKCTMVGIDQFNDLKDKIEKAMRKLAEQLPIYAWTQKPEQRGFGTLFLAIVIGETGDLTIGNNFYSNPGKLWKRLGCAPYKYDGQTKMGSTWRSGKEGKLPAEEWAKFGYSPRRRSISYLIGESIVKQNFKPGGTKEDKKNEKYREAWEFHKTRFAQNHPDYTPKRCHLHGMLVATKVLLKTLWWEWNGRPQMGVHELDNGHYVWCINGNYQ